MRALVFNPGSNSLKFEVIDTATGQTTASQATKRISAAIEDFGKAGKRASFSILEGRKTVQHEEVEVPDITAATELAVEKLRTQEGGSLLADLDFLGVRVVHGGPQFTSATRYDDAVRRKIESLEDLAPLHNKSSLAIIDAVHPALPNLPIAVTLDTAFHRTLPEAAWRYPLEKSVSDRHGIRKFGFHGVSHRYLLERYAELSHKTPETCTGITLHLESGSSACAIRNGASVDTSMGLTPLEGLMMGTRSGSIDPAIVEVLMRKEKMDVHDAIQFLNKRSGLFGISGDLDTRLLAKREDADARLALEMFTYRVQQTVGAYLAVLGGADAIIFGAGIGEDSPEIRAGVCENLGFAGVKLDAALNTRSTQGEAKISSPTSSMEVWAMPSEEGLQIAHECAIALHPA